MAGTIQDAAGLFDQITSVLLADPRVAAARVVPGLDAGGQPAPLGWVVPAAAWIEPARQKAQAGQARTAVKLWARVFDTAYFAGEDSSATPPSYAGWSSSLTGAPFPAAEMGLWRRHTVERILALQPVHVLEIGCGLGLLLEQIAPHCESYRATDVSAEAIGRLQAWAAKQDTLRHVEVAQRAAHELDGLPDGTFDTVIINSVVQYFPDFGYLARVLAAVAPLLTAGGRVFVGDVRDVRLLPAFNAAVALAQAGAGATAGDLRRALHERDEPELAIDPAAFASLAGYGSARALLKRDGADNEMTRYRYDLVLGTAARAPASVPARAWDSATDAAAALPARAPGDATPLLLRGIPNARVVADLQAVRMIWEAPAELPVAALRAKIAAGPPTAQDPGELAGAAERLGHRAEPLCGATADRFDLLLSDPAAPPPALPATAREPQPASDPLLARLAAPLLASLRQAIAERLPAVGMVSLTAVPALPSLG